MLHLTGHPNVVMLRGAFEDKQNVHLVMELCSWVVRAWPCIRQRLMPLPHWRMEGGVRRLWGEDGRRSWPWSLFDLESFVGWALLPPLGAVAGAASCSTASSNVTITPSATRRR